MCLGIILIEPVIEQKTLHNLKDLATLINLEKSYFSFFKKATYVYTLCNFHYVSIRETVESRILN